MIVGLLLLATPVLAAPAAPVVLRMATVAPPSSPYYQGCKLAAQLAERNSKGAIKVRVFPSGMMGSE